MLIFKRRCKDLDAIVRRLYPFIGVGQIIYLSPDNEYSQANLVDVTLGDRNSREITLTVEGYRKLTCTDNDLHLPTVTGGIEIKTQLIKLDVKYLQVQKKGTPNERFRVYCRLGSVYFLKKDHPLSLHYDNKELITGPTRADFVKHMQARNL